MKIKLVALLSLLGLAITFPSFAEEKVTKAVKPYPLKTCVVSGETLGEMAKPYVFQQDGREVQLCCKSCLKDFKKEPAKYMKKLDETGKAKM